MGRPKFAGWEEVEIITEEGKNWGSGGTKIWKCKHCNNIYKGSAPRLKAHLLNIPGQGIAVCSADIPDNVIIALGGDPVIINRAKRARMEIQSGDENVDLRQPTSVADSSPYIGSSRATTIGSDSTIPTASRSPLPNVSAFSSQPSDSQRLPTKGKGKKGALQESWQKLKHEKARRAVRQYFFECNVPFDHARKPTFINMLSAVAKAGESFKPPNYETLRTKELRAEVSDIEKELVPFKTAWAKYGCTILCDGWSDVKRRPLINILVSSCLGTTFLTSIDGSTEAHTAHYIYEHLRAAILEVGPSNVISVITDNASNCKLAGSYVEADFPHICWVPCASHSLDLLIEDIGKIAWVGDVVKKAEYLVNFVCRKQRALGIFRANCDVELAKPSSTRFAYLFIVLQKLLKCKVGLRRMITDSRWIAWPTSTSPKGVMFEDLIHDSSFWRDAEAIIGFMEPLIVALRLSDSEGCTMGLIYEFMDKVGGAFDTCTHITGPR